MTSNMHRKIMYGVAAMLLVVAVISYAAFPLTPPEEPLRIVYQSAAGSVLFDHQTHATSKGYALSCTDCHHLHFDYEIEPVSCGLCHAPPRPGSVPPESCLDCHSDVAEFAEPDTLKRSDALHKQCIGCHEAFGKGPPGDAESCSQCHVM
jgi:hypothetical protein